MQCVLIAGGTGFVGRHLAKLLQEKGYAVRLLSRRRTESAHIFYWNPETGEYDARALEGVEALINLSGAGVADKRWNAAYKKTMRESRTQSTALLVRMLRETPNAVQTVVNASATGWYGSDTEAVQQKGGFAETDPPANTFFGQICKQWEAAAQPFAELKKRLVILRIGLVLHPEGGLLRELLKPLRFGIAPVLGNAGRILSWIHIQDLCRMFCFALENKNVEGVYNAVAPNPVPNRQLAVTVASSRQRFYIPVPVPAFLVKWIVGSFAEELLNSVTVRSSKISETGFVFTYPQIEKALVFQESVKQ